MNVNIVSLQESSVSKNVSLVSACILSHVRPCTGRQILYRGASWEALVAQW